MKFKKIQLSKNKTLNVVYTNNDGDIVTVAGGNVVHPDLEAAFATLVPHLAFLTEQREIVGLTLDDVENIREAKEMGRDDSRDIYIRINVISVSFKAESVQLQGSRCVSMGDVIPIVSPNVNVTESYYRYLPELSLAMDNLIYEAKAYIEEKKWRIKETYIDFKEEDPFEGMDVGEVPSVTIEIEKPKKKKKKNSVA